MRSSSNSLIFRNLAVRSRAVGYARSQSFGPLGHLPAVTARFTTNEAVVGTAP